MEGSLGGGGDCEDGWLIGFAVAVEWVVYTNYEAYDGYSSMLHWRGSVAYNGFEK